MDTQIVAVFCLVDDMLKALHHYEDRQCVMSDAEVMTTAMIASAVLWRQLHPCPRAAGQSRICAPDVEQKSLFAALASHQTLLAGLVQPAG